MTGTNLLQFLLSATFLKARSTLFWNLLIPVFVVVFIFHSIFIKEESIYSENLENNRFWLVSHTIFSSYKILYFRMLLFQLGRRATLRNSIYSQFKSHIPLNRYWLRWKCSERSRKMFPYLVDKWTQSS